MELNLTPQWKKEASVIMVSGGVDSAYLLYKQLRDTKTNIHAHHINFVGHEKYHREDVEQEACINIWGYLSKIRNFSHSMSTIDLSTFPYTGWDSDTQLFIGSRVAMNLTADKVSLMLGVNADDFAEPAIQERAKRGASTKLWTAILGSMDDVFRKKMASEVSYPLKNITKCEIMNDMPQELIDLTWSCREPVRDNGEIIACGKCHACKQLIG